MAVVYSSYSSSFTPSGASIARKYRSFIHYYATADTPTYTTYYFDYGVEINEGANIEYSVTGAATGHSNVSATLATRYSGTEVKVDRFSNHSKAFSVTYQKGHSAVTKTASVSSKGTTGAPSAWKNTALSKSVNFTIAAKPSYGVSYNANGGSGAPGGQTKWYDEALALSATQPTRAGYTFGGWSGSNGVTYAAGGTVAAGVNQALVLTAIWNAIPYTLTYNANGGTVSPASKSVAYGSAYGTLPVPTRADYYHLGWFTDPTAGSQVSASTTMGIGGATIYAHWHHNPSITPTVDSTGPYYTTGCTYSVDISDLELYDSATATIRLNIGALSTNITGEGTLEIQTTQQGTFTPTVTLTDSLGASVVYTLSPITVDQYTAPSVRGSGAYRTDTNGKLNDEGLSAVVGYVFTWVDDLGSISAPSIKVNGVSVSAAWYKNYDGYTSPYLSNLITETDWSTVQSGDAVYALITNAFYLDNSYEISVTISDAYETSSEITETLSQAFFTMEFLNGGKGVTIGKPATNEGFEVAMESVFEDDVTFNTDILLEIDTSAASGVDHDLYEAIVALGWENDVLVN